MNLEETKIKENLFLKGLSSFNESDFYDAHEYWEDLWSDYYLPDSKFIQALIQLSVGYFHITNNNKNGALGLLNKCIPKFELYRPECRGLDIEYILIFVYRSIECLNNIEEMKDFNWDFVPRLELNHG